MNLVCLIWKIAHLVQLLCLTFVFCEHWEKPHQFKLCRPVIVPLTKQVPEPCYVKSGSDFSVTVTYFLSLLWLMASQQDLDFTYTTIDKVFRLSMGETGDYSGAMYNGDFSLTLEQAQEQKHKFIADSLNVKGRF